jgi:hippurate hydrolase
MLTAAILGLALAAPIGSPLAPLEPLYPSLEALYIDLHQHPELSLQERETTAKLAARLEALGNEVTIWVGGYGVGGPAEERPWPDRAPTIRVAVSTQTVSALELLGKP